jgi:uncharacterized protein YbjT (DUF2867 family)
VWSHREHVANFGEKDREKSRRPESLDCRRLLDRSGIPVTHLRPTFFAEWLMYLSESIRERNMFPLPFGDARYSPIAAEDQGRVIAAILNDSAEHAGKTYPLYGPKESSQYEIADILTQVLNTDFVFLEGAFEMVYHDKAGAVEVTDFYGRDETLAHLSFAYAEMLSARTAGNAKRVAAFAHLLAIHIAEKYANIAS